MKKLVAIFIVFIYVTSFTEVHQLYKLPVLWQHFVEHQQKDKDITFWAYLADHYQSHDDHDGDHGRDMELPFKDFDHCSSVQAVTLPGFKIEIKPITFPFEKTYACFYNKFIAAFHLTDIWQPPKF